MACSRKMEGEYFTVFHLAFSLGRSGTIIMIYLTPTVVRVHMALRQPSHELHRGLLPGAIPSAPGTRALSLVEEYSTSADTLKRQVGREGSATDGLHVSTAYRLEKDITGVQKHLHLVTPGWHVSEWAFYISLSHSRFAS